MFRISNRFEELFGSDELFWYGFAGSNARCARHRFRGFNPRVHTSLYYNVGGAACQKGARIQRTQTVPGGPESVGLCRPFSRGPGGGEPVRPGVCSISPRAEGAATGTPACARASSSAARSATRLRSSSGATTRSLGPTRWAWARASWAAPWRPWPRSARGRGACGRGSRPRPRAG